MRSVSQPQQAKYGTVTLPVRLGWYEVLASAFGDKFDEPMFVVLPARPQKAHKMAKELRAIAKRLEEQANGTG